MAGTLVEYARFVEVQHLRARIVAELVQSPRDTPVEANGESRREFCSMTSDAAQQAARGGEDRRHTTRGSVDVC